MFWLCDTKIQLSANSFSWLKMLPEHFNDLTLLQKTLFGIKYHLPSTMWHKGCIKIHPSVASGLLIQSTGTFLPTLNPDQNCKRSWCSGTCGLRVEMLFSSQLTPYACQCKIMYCYCVGTGILASLFHAVVSDVALGLQKCWENLCQKRVCVLQGQALTTRAKCIAKTCRSTIFNRLEIEHDSGHFNSLFIHALDSLHMCKVPLEQEFTVSKSQACSLEPFNHTTDFISGRSN